MVGEEVRFGKEEDKKIGREKKEAREDFVAGEDIRFR